MADLFEVKDVDKQFYEARLRDFLPQKIFDIHTHVWREDFLAKSSDDPKRAVTWPSLVAKDNPIEDLEETYRLMFPDKQVTPLIFSNLQTRDDDIDGANAYISKCADEHGCPSLIFAMPWWTAEEFEQKIIADGFLGAKVYLIFSDPKISQKDITIFDFLPHHQLEVLNKLGLIAMLHIPRDGRLRDPKNLEQMLEIEKRYPNVKLIIAHVGRAYCNEDVGDAFNVLSETKNMMFDFCANTNSWVFEQLIKAVGPKRVLFGSDLPILRMRTRRICEDGNYVNLIPKGHYGDVSGDSHMREVEGAEADNLTFFMYEEIDAFRRAAEATNLSRVDIEDVFYNNARALIESVKPAQPQLMMVWPIDKLNSPPAFAMPEGYTLRTYCPGDEEGYLRLMKIAGFEAWTIDNVRDSISKALSDGLFFIVHDATNTIVATSAAVYQTDVKGELGWVAADPDHKGKGLGGIVCSAVTGRLINAGCKEIYLKTDDFRLPAIKTYFKLGFVPRIETADLKKRWQSVCNELGLDFEAFI